MAYDREPGALPTEVFKALGDPIRWSIVTQMAAVDELPCLALEDTLPVSKPTISYHTKILHHAGLISVRKEGRNYFYTLRRDALHEALDSLWELAPTPRPIVGQQKGYVRSAARQADAAGRASAGRTRARAAGTRTAGARAAGAGSSRRGVTDSGEEAVVLTW